VHILFTVIFFYYVLNSHYLFNQSIIYLWNKDKPTRQWR